MSFDLSTVKGLKKDLLTNVGKLQTILNMLNTDASLDESQLAYFQDNATKLLGRMQKAVDQMTDTVAVRTADDDVSSSETAGTGFAQFLSDVGESVVRSQEALDQQSLNYLRKIKDLPMIPRTMFRIPKISAEFKLGIETTGKEKINVLLYAKESEAKKINQQSINVEIAAVPVTPEFQSSLQDSIPSIQFVFNTAQRENLFKALTSAVTSANAKLKKQLNLLLLPENKNQVVFWATSEPAEFIVLFADGKSVDDQTNANNKVGVWLLDEDKKTIEAVMRYDLKAKPLEQQGHLQKFVQRLAAKQMAILNV